MFTSFQNLCSAVTATDKNLLITAQNHLDNLTKPVGSLGRLEEFAAKLFTVYQGKFPLQPDPALHILAAADHGVFEEGVAQNPQEVTHLMILNILQGGAAISVLTKQNIIITSRVLNSFTEQSKGIKNVHLRIMTAMDLVS